jgi:hypothetical protein
MVKVNRKGQKESTYHRRYIGMRDSIELVKFQLVLGPNVDVSSLVFSAVAIPRSGKDLQPVSFG